MKIAYLFHGHLRTFRENTTIVPMLLARHPGDVFVQTFAMRNFRGNKWHHDDGGADEAVSVDDLAYLGQWLPNIVACDVSPLESGAAALPADCGKMGFRWAKQRACEMRQEYERKHRIKYDLVFLARYDLGFRDPVTLPDVIDPNTYYGGYNANQVRAGLDGEVFVYGAPHVIDSVMIPAIPPELTADIPDMGFVGEKLMTAVRKSKGFVYQAHDVRHFLYRTHGQLDVMHE